MIIRDFHNPNFSFRNEIKNFLSGKLKYMLVNIQKKKISEDVFSF